MNSVKIFQEDHFIKSYEDRKNNLFIIELNNDVDQWIQKNVKGDYDLDCEELYTSDTDIDYVYVIFEDEDDALRFKLRWKYYEMYKPNTFGVDMVVDSRRKGVLTWLKENVGPQFFTWNIYWNNPETFSFYDKEDAIHFKLRWG